MARASLTASCSASSRTASSRTPFASSADMPDTRSRAATCSPWARARSSRVLSSSRSRSRSLRSRCSSMSVRWSSCSSRWRRRRSRPDSSLRLARASSSASRCMPELLVLRLEDQLLLAGPGLGLDAARLGRGRLHRLGCPDAAQEHAATTPPTAATTTTARMSTGSIFCSSRPTDCGSDVLDAVDGSIARWAGLVAVGEMWPLPGPRSSLCCGPRPRSGTRFVWCVAYGRHSRGSTATALRDGRRAADGRWVVRCSSQRTSGSTSAEWVSCDATPRSRYSNRAPTASIRGRERSTHSRWNGRVSKGVAGSNRPRIGPRISRRRPRRRDRHRPRPP